MPYEPHPQDTSEVDIPLPGDVVEDLAKHVHEVWAAERVAQGWTYGPNRDDTQKKTPDLAPYSELPESEKEFDRKTGLQSLKFLLKKGYRLTIPMSVDPPRVRDGFSSDDAKIPDDMDDSAELEHLKRIGSPLVPVLETIRDTVAKAYGNANNGAMLLQRRFRIVAWVTFICCVFSVLMSIGQLGEWKGKSMLLYPELILVIGAVVVVVAAINFQYQDGWLVERCKAERLRALKYKTLLDPILWGPRQTDCLARLQADVSKISGMHAEDLAHLLIQAEPGPAPCLLTSEKGIHGAVLEYYLNRRLLAQLRYCAHNHHKNHAEDARWKTILKALFFAVLGVVCVHAALETADRGEGVFPTLLLYSAAGIPVLCLAAHVYRSSREAGRNALRLRATESRLTDIRKRLQTSYSAEEQVGLAVEAEAVLASENQQWLQLMKECEWFG